MLSARAYSFRLKSRLAISLSWVAGYTNVVAFMMCGGVVVSHVTGNVTQFGKALSDVGMAGGAGPAAREAAYFGFLVAAFLCGAVASAVLTETARRRGSSSKYVVPMAVEAILLAAFAIGIDLHVRHRIEAGRTIHFYWMSGAAAVAMGLQNATITRISGAVVRTTHLTGVVTDLGLEGVQYLAWAWDRVRAGLPDRRGRRAGRVLSLSRRHPSVLRLALLASIFGSFLFGVVAGTLAFSAWPTRALLAPIGFLLWIIGMDRRKPIADVRELDLTADEDYREYASVRALLPAGLGLYRLVHPRRDAPHRAPDFQAWVDRLPRHWRVVILAVSPMTSFDADEALDLAAALQKLRASRRDLVVCGVRPPQYWVLARSGFVDALGIENLCPDFDLALARGLNLVSETGTAQAVAFTPGANG